MFNLLKDAYQKMEGVKGKKLIYTLLAVFLVFSIIGISIGYLMSFRLTKNEKIDVTEYRSGESTKSTKIEAEGRITYVNPDLYPLDNVSFSLTDYTGKDIYLLKADDQKLNVAEGLTAKVIGKIEKLSDNKTEVLVVEEVIIKSAAD